MLKKTLLLPLAALYALATASLATAFPEKDINFVIPYGPGGGNDTIVRMIAPFLEEHLPGNVNVVPQNVPGAGGQRGATTVYRASPDGHTIGLFPMPGLALPGLLGEETPFDLREITWIGRIEASHYVLMVRGDSEFHSLEDLLQADEVRFLSTGFGATMLAASQVTAAVADINATFLTGYQSSSEALVGTIRGDGDAVVAIIEPSLGYIRAGDLRPIAMSIDHASLPETPTFAEAGYPELMNLSLERWVGAPADLPEERLETLREAFRAALNDPEFQQQAETAGMTVDTDLGGAGTELIEQGLDFYDQYRESLRNPVE